MHGVGQDVPAGTPVVMMFHGHPVAGLCGSGRTRGDRLGAYAGQKVTQVISHQHDDTVIFSDEFLSGPFFAIPLWLFAHQHQVFGIGFDTGFREPLISIQLSLGTISNHSIFLILAMLLFCCAI